MTHVATTESPSVLGLHPVTADELANDGAGTAPHALVVAIDGTSGSGKSTTAKALARELDGDYVDTGAMYRAVSWWMLRESVNLGQPANIAAAAQGVQIAVVPDPSGFAVSCNEFDVTTDIRSVEVTEAVSAVAAVPEVRAMLCAYQRSLAGAAAAKGRAMVMEGRDIGTVVLPTADLKIWLTADLAARASRRAGDGEGPVSDTSARLITRDLVDSTRAVSPAHKAADAIEIDTTHISVDAVVAHVVDLALAAQRSLA